MDNIKQNTVSVWKGIIKFYKVSVGVIEAFSWLILLATAWIIAYKTLKNYISINEVELGILLIAAFVISFRLAYEGAKYFRDLGENEKVE